jgi:hypothetical protein
VSGPSFGLPLLPHPGVCAAVGQGIYKRGRAARGNRFAAADQAEFGWGQLGQRFPPGARSEYIFWRCGKCPLGLGHSLPTPGRPACMGLAISSRTRGRAPAAPATEAPVASRGYTGRWKLENGGARRRELTPSNIGGCVRRPREWRGRVTSAPQQAKGGNPAEREVRRRDRLCKLPIFVRSETRTSGLGSGHAPRGGAALLQHESSTVEPR